MSGAQAAGENWSRVELVPPDTARVACYDVTVAAGLLNVSPRRVRQLVRAGRLHAVAWRPLRVTASSVLDYAHYADARAAARGDGDPPPRSIDYGREREAVAPEWWEERARWHAERAKQLHATAGEWQRMQSRAERAVLYANEEARRALTVAAWHEQRHADCRHLLGGGEFFDDVWDMTAEQDGLWGDQLEDADGEEQAGDE